MMAVNGLIAKEVKELVKDTVYMAISKIRLERGSNGEVKTGNDWEVDGERMQSLMCLDRLQEA